MWEALEIGYSDFLGWALSDQLSAFYEDLRWPTWREDLQSASADQCFSFFPFLWTREGSVQGSSRKVRASGQAQLQGDCLLVPGAAAKDDVAGYRWRNVAIGGGGFVSGLVFHPHEKGLLYARTDIGGAYRWQPREQRWHPLMDWMGHDDSGRFGVESLALDPSDPDRVYLAVGTYLHERGQDGAINVVVKQTP